MTTMTLKEYQKNAVSNLLDAVTGLLNKDGTRLCVFKAPTGSGKTIMVADFLEKLSHEQLPHKLSFLWVSAHNLHKQSRKKLEFYLNDSLFTFSYLEDVQDRVIKENEIVFINWEEITKKDGETGEYNNIFMRENEYDRNLPSFIHNTLDEGREIILIVDESHYYYWSEETQRLVTNTLQPKLILEVSATPRVEPSLDDLQNNEAGRVAIKFEDVVASGMIKEEIIINEQFQNIIITNQTADDLVIDMALKKQNQLRQGFTKLGKRINPLIIIQLPSKSQSLSQLDTQKIDVIKRILKENHDITVENGKMAIWLSEEKENLDRIENMDNGVDVLIFKQAIAIGWDCPRAQILIMFRETQSVIFEIQTVGRIMRMPEVEHYDNEILNKAYIYTNLPRIQIKPEVIDRSYFSHQVSKRSDLYDGLEITSTYLKRTDYGDITFSFRKAFMDEANNYFEIKSTDMMDEAYKKASKKMILDSKKLTEPVISDEILKNPDIAQLIEGKTIDLSIPEENIKEKFNLLTKALSLPFAPIRSFTKIQQSIYDWFDKYLGYKDRSRLDIQKSVLCSEGNQKVIIEIIERAKHKYLGIREEEIRSKSRIKKNDRWDVPEMIYFNDLYVKTDYSKHILQPAYMQGNRSSVEVEFEQLLNQSTGVKWWYKNGVSSEDYLGILYEDSVRISQAIFYPDFIVKYHDGRFGIYDTKDGQTATSPETKDKAEALQKYIKGNKRKKITGGIVIHNSRGWFIHDGEKYSYDDNLQGWKSLSF